jgi:hypothetical protein
LNKDGNRQKTGIASNDDGQAEPQAILKESLDRLYKTRDEQMRRVEQAQQVLFQIESAIRALQDVDRARGGAPHMPTSRDYAGMGIIRAVEKLFAEEGDGLSTREIADIIRDRGVFTRSKDFVTSLFATMYGLSDAKGAKADNPRFTRRGPARKQKWYLIKRVRTRTGNDGQ